MSEPQKPEWWDRFWRSYPLAEGSKTQPFNEWVRGEIEEIKRRLAALERDAAVNGNGERG